MRIAYTPEQERLRRELRGYFGGLMTPEVRAALSPPGNGAGGDGDYGDGQAYRQVVRQLGRDGWLALGWPQEHGGRGGTMLDQLIFTDEAAIARVPVPFLTINTVGPTIMRFGTPAQQVVLPAADRRGRDPLLDRLLRAGGRHRPGVAAHHGEAGR